MTSKHDLTCMLSKMKRTYMLNDKKSRINIMLTCFLWNYNSMTRIHAHFWNDNPITIMLFWKSCMVFLPNTCNLFPIILNIYLLFFIIIKAFYFLKFLYPLHHFFMLYLSFSFYLEYVSYFEWKMPFSKILKIYPCLFNE